MGQLHLGWHFCALSEGKPLLRDGTLLEIGREYEHSGRLVMCSRGYHDSARVIDALRYAPGPYLCRTLSSRDLIDSDKHCSRYRRALVGCDLTRTLHEFAVRIAFCALLAEREQGREPHPDSWKALHAKQAWLRGELTGRELSAACCAAESVARGATQSAAWSVAWSAAQSAVRNAAWNAAESAVRNAAWDAAGSAAWDAADSLLMGMLPAPMARAFDDGRIPRG